MFDVNNTITIGLRTEKGKADVTVRWPSDEEWATHRRRRKIIRRDLGRGASENEVDNTEGDLRLYETITVNGAPPLTGAEASRIIEVIAECNVINVDLGADQAEVEVVTCMGETKHHMRIPTYEEVRKLNRSNRMVSLPFNRFEIRTFLEAGAELWDKCGGAAEGYNGPVPNLHKDTVMRAVVEAINQEAAPRHDESNF